jgi:hypothetical protein
MGQSTLLVLAVYIVVKHIIVGIVIIQQLVIYLQSVEMMMMVFHTHFESSAYINNFLNFF